MAQLGNLLVKGSSRFLNKAYFEDVYICGDVSTGGKLDITANEGKAILSLNGKKALEAYDTWLNINESRDFTAGIYCGTGVLRTDGEFQVSNIKTGVKFKVNNSSLASNVPSTFSAQATFNGGLIANSANISEEICNTLIVKDELRSAKWNIDNITNLGSTFYVSPCIVFTNPSVYVNSISGTTVVLTITDNSITSSTIGGATWTNGSKIKLMGRIGNSALGTINGVLKRDLNSSTAKTAYISLDFPNTDLIKFSAGATYSGSNVGDLKMMMYEVNKNVNGTTKNRPIGILLSSYGENKKPCIDIYNGDIEDGSPVVRMGYLNGLPSVNGVNPTGYGFYAAGNAYFSGTLVSSSGKIGGFSLSENSIQNGAWGQSGSVLICTGTNSFASIGGSNSINGWCFTASSTFGVTKTGALYASNATIKGNITATSGKIGSFSIDSTYLQSSDKTVGLSASASDWAFWAGGGQTSTAKFRVNHAGQLWASNAVIAGNIMATSGKIGKYSIDGNLLITGSGSTCTGMGGDQAFWAGSNNSNNAPFHVSYNGSLYASKANISGTINSTDGSIGGWNIKNSSIYVKSTDGLKQTSLNSDSQKIEFKLTRPASAESDGSSSFLNISNSNLSPYIELGWRMTSSDGNSYWGNRNYISEDSISISSKADIDSSVTISSNDIILSDTGNKLTISPGYLQFENGGSISPDCLEFENGVSITPNQKVLWESVAYMNGDQTVTFYNNETISNQLFGIVLVWSGYSNGKANNGDVHTQFIPKWCVTGKSMAFCMTDAYRHINKYFYVYDDKIVGNNINDKNGTKGGITYNNYNCVLRAVIGV